MIPADPVAYFDWIYEKWDLEWERFGEHPSLDGLRVLDFGSGFGSFAARAAQEGASVVGVDIDATKVEFARNHFRERFPTIDAEFATDLSQVGTGFDIIMTHEVFEHILDLRACLTALYDHLRPGGILYAGWGPLWMSPLGGHQLMLHIGKFPIPFSHLATKTALARYRKRTGSTANSLDDLQLNGLRPRDYERHLRHSRFEVIRWTANAGRHPGYKALRLAARIAPSLATSNIYAVLRKVPEQIAAP
jgi:SAM-dependent methyltransferase